MTAVVNASLRRAPRRVACSVVQSLLYASASEGWNIPTGLGRHQATCLNCQAETVRQKLVLRGLGEMAHVVEQMPYDLAEALHEGGLVASDSLDAYPNTPRRASRTAIASAASIAAIGAVVIAGRRLRAS